MVCWGRGQAIKASGSVARCECLCGLGCKCLVCGRERLGLYDGDELGRSRCRVTRTRAEGGGQKARVGRASTGTGSATRAGTGEDAEEFSAEERWGLAARLGRARTALAQARG